MSKSMKKGDSFTSDRRKYVDPDTGRKLIQLTSGDCFDYHLYYFIPSITSDSKSIIFHRHRQDEVQLYRIDIETGLTVKLTDAETSNSLWRPWLQKPGNGVRDLLSAFNTVTNEAIYFNSNEIHAVHIYSLEDRLLFRVPEDRVPNGLTGVSPDGKRFVFVHSDRAWWEKSLATGPKRHEARRGKLDVLEIETGKVRTLVQINTWITHSNFYDNDRVLFCHLATENAILMTDLHGGYYEHLRTQDESGATCHYIATNRGIMYEAANHIGGIYDPDTHTCTEYELGLEGYVHTGHDPEARLWFYESHDRKKDIHIISYFKKLACEKANKPIPLIGNMKTYWLGQRSHFHPQITPNRKFILFTGGDSANQTNHLFLLDIADLNDTTIEV
jgi:hypothetical protein